MNANSPGSSGIRIQIGPLNSIRARAKVLTPKGHLSRVIKGFTASPLSAQPQCRFQNMRLFAVPYLFLYTQLSRAAPSSPPTSQNKRSPSFLSGDPAFSSLDTNKCGPRVASSWYASWHSSDVPLSAVSWSKYNSVTYAFA